MATNWDEEIRSLRCDIHDQKAEIARLRSDEPGTPLGRLKGIGDYAVKVGLCSGIEAKPAELFLIESHARLQEELDKAHRLCSQMFGWHRDYEIKNAKLRVALEAQLEAHNYAEVLEIARKALANEAGK